MTDRTDHSAEIAAMRERANLIVHTFPGGDAEPSQAMVLEATILMAFVPNGV